MMARGSPRGERLVAAAAGFWLFWTVLSVFARVVGFAAGRDPVQLAAWLALGLHVTLVWTPLELSRAWGRALGTIFGGRIGALGAAATLTLLKEAPTALEDARLIGRTVAFRAEGRSFRRRLAFFGRALIRQASSRVDDLARAMISR
jgi:hypothetical protein